ncbi:hypothetical protein TIFTF001_054929 [Ficus carica]|uniref:Uncharacterized protein n=1 Tax=Ficus carica TaxID=3494 RepID=A0AA88EID2_FICCA|nr:hypothetical protein TIFTF001_054928 [Ficus carica]GMN73921.1 hypothetical protein TIFTF001_054929 [Ficus carica]
MTAKLLFSACHMYLARSFSVLLIWDLQSSSFYVLSNNWYNVAERNELKQLGYCADLASCSSSSAAAVAVGIVEDYLDQRSNSDPAL